MHLKVSTHRPRDLEEIDVPSPDLCTEEEGHQVVHGFYARVRGTPMPRHVALPGLTADLFKRRLSPCGETTSSVGRPAMQERATDRASRTAASLCDGHRVSRGAGCLTEAA